MFPSFENEFNVYVERTDETNRAGLEKINFLKFRRATSILTIIVILLQLSLIKWIIAPMIAEQCATGRWREPPTRWWRILYNIQTVQSSGVSAWLTRSVKAISLI